MNKILSVSLALAAVFYCTVSQAQTQTQSPSQTPPQLPAQASPQTQTPPAVGTGENNTAGEHKASLEERSSQCLKGEGCSTQARLQIIQEENDALNDHFQKIHQACADANFQNCIDNKKEDVQAWYSDLNGMQKMMDSLEAQTMNQKEPSSGGPASPDTDEKPKTFWQKIWPFGDNNNNSNSDNTNSDNSK